MLLFDVFVVCCFEPALLLRESLGLAAAALGLALAEPQVHLPLDGRLHRGLVDLLVEHREQVVPAARIADPISDHGDLSAARETDKMWFSRRCAG